jgi:hypothetical protein
MLFLVVVMIRICLSLSVMILALTYHTRGARPLSQPSSRTRSPCYPDSESRVGIHPEFSALYLGPWSIHSSLYTDMGVYIYIYKYNAFILYTIMYAYVIK